MRGNAMGRRVMRVGEAWIGRAVLAGVLIGATTVVVVTVGAQPAPAAPPPSPGRGVQNQSFTVPGTYTYVVPTGTATFFAVAQGGSGQKGNGEGGGQGGMGNVAISTPTVQPVGATTQPNPGDVLTIQVGGQGGHNSGSTCGGGNGGGGNEVGQSGGQGGQCSFVYDTTQHFYLTMAAGGGGGGGQGGGGGGGGGGGAGGYNTSAYSGAITLGYGVGQGGQVGSLGGSGGSPNTDPYICQFGAAATATGAGGHGAATASDAGGGGGGGGGCGGGGGGNPDFEGGGGGAGGNATTADGSTSDLGVAGSPGDGSVVLYASTGVSTVGTGIGPLILSTPLRNVPANAVSMTFLAAGNTGKVFDGQSAPPGGLVFGTAAIGGSSPIVPGEALSFGGNNATNDGTSFGCAGGAGGQEATGESNGRDGGGCAFVAVGQFSRTVGLAVAGGGGGASGDYEGGAAGQPGQGYGVAVGGPAGSCTAFELDAGQAGENAVTQNNEGSGGGGGGCGGGGRGINAPNSAFSLGDKSGGGGGGGNFALNSSYASGAAYTNAIDTFGGEVRVFFTLASRPAITTASSASFTAAQPNTFTVQASGVPTAALSESGALPAGISFHDNGDGTATLSGTPSSGDAGPHSLTITASNGPFDTQDFTLNIDTPPSFITADAGQMSKGQSNTIAVRTGGFPHAALSESGPLPTGVTFHDNLDGTGTLSGTPADASNDSYSFDLTAANGISPSATQHFTLTVDGPPRFTTASTTVFTTGVNGTFTVATAGQPPPILREVDGAAGTGLPVGVTFKDNGDGTGTISGTPAAGQTGTFTFVITAENQFTTTTQNFSLVVQGAPTFLSGNSYTYSGTGPVGLDILTTGLPALSLRTDAGQTGPPTGVILEVTGIGRGLLTGTPTSAPGTYTFTLVAHNGLGDATQVFTFVFQGAPTFTSADHETFTVGQSQSFTIQTAANPAVQFLTIPSPDSNPLHALPSGLSLTYSRGNNTATISGVPDAGTSDIYTLTIDAENFPGGTPAHTQQTFTLTVVGPPKITSAGGTSFTMGAINNFTVQIAGQPSATSVTATGLPSWAQLINNGQDTATLTGTPPPGSPASIPLTITADNGNAPAATQSFTLRTVGPPSRLALFPANQNIQVGSPQVFHAEAFDQFNDDLGNVTGTTTFAMTNGTCGGNVCSSTVAGAQTVTGTYGTVAGTATLNEAPGGPSKLTLTPDPATIVSGGSQTYEVKAVDVYANPLGDVSGSSLNTLTISPDGSCNKGTISCTATTNGKHTVTATYGVNAATATLNVYTPVTLAQGSPTSATSTYGQGYAGALAATNGSTPVTYNATSGDTTKIGVSSAGAITAAPTLAAGTYTVGGTDSDPASDAGTWSFTLTVQPATLTVTASNVATAYGAAAPPPTPGYAGFVNGQGVAVLTAPAICAADYVRGMAPAVYPGKTHCAGAAGPNYTVTYVAGTLTVNPWPMTVTAASGDMTYGATPPPITPSYSPFVNGDGVSSLTTPATCYTVATSHSPVGGYLSRCGGAVDPNYVFGYLDGTVTVHPASLTVTAPNRTRAYGSANPALAPAYQGLVPGDTAASLTTAPTCATTATTTSLPGSYPITCNGGVSPNYTFTYVAGTLTVTKAATTAALKQSPNPAAFGTPVTLTATVSGAGTPTGTVQFQTAGGELGPPVTLSGGTAMLTTTGMLTGQPVTAVYSGDAGHASSTAQITPVITYAHTVTGAQPGGTTVSGGTWLLSGASFTGALTVASNTTVVLANTNVGGIVSVATGSSIVLQNATIGGGLTATSPGSVTMCGTTIGGNVMISGATGFVVLGDPGDDACAANDIHGGVSLAANHGGVELGSNRIGGSASVSGTSGRGPFSDDTGTEIEANGITGTLSCSGNTPAASSDGQRNSVGGSRLGECGLAGF
ncbi:MAG TPA: MBG domain-containing protein [Acidimicrobiales bacterium]|nr:MBG domain-containing protein [Acidimicrobiales bacterium]